VLPFRTSDAKTDHSRDDTNDPLPLRPHAQPDPTQSEIAAHMSWLFPSRFLTA
jgi:hypothetical protein